MPTSLIDGAYWKLDFDLMKTLPGADLLEKWFGFATDFHDSELLDCMSDGSTATLVLAAFRMSSKVDPAGFYILDRHATVTLHFEDVSEVRIEGDLPTTVLELGFRQSTQMDGEARIEMAYDDVCGGGGSVLAGKVRIHFEPIEKSA